MHLLYNVQGKLHASYKQLQTEVTMSTQLRSGRTMEGLINKLV